MSVQRSRKVLITYFIFVLVIGVASVIVTGFRNGIWAGQDALLGLLIGAAASVINYLLLSVSIKNLFSEHPKDDATNNTLGRFIAVQIYIARILIYLVAAFISVRFGFAAAVTFACAVVGISAAIFIVYGIGGLRSDD